MAEGYVHKQNRTDAGRRKNKGGREVDRQVSQKTDKQAGNEKAMQEGREIDQQARKQIDKLTDYQTVTQSDKYVVKRETGKQDARRIAKPKNRLLGRHPNTQAGKQTSLDSQSIKQTGRRAGKPPTGTQSGRQEERRAETKSKGKQTDSKHTRSMEFYKYIVNGFGLIAIFSRFLYDILQEKILKLYFCC